MGGPRLAVVGFRDPRLAEAVVAIWCAEQGAMCVFVGGPRICDPRLAVQAIWFCEPGMSVIGFGDPGVTQALGLIGDHRLILGTGLKQARGFGELAGPVSCESGYQSVSVSCESGLVICDPGILASCREAGVVSVSCESGLVICNPGLAV